MTAADEAGRAVEHRAYRYLDLITAAFVAVLIISNVASTKIVVLPPFTFDGGTILFPLAYIFGDILTEVYGFRRARRVIWSGFVAIVVAAATFALVDALPAAPGYPFAESFHNIFGLAPRIVAGSLLGYLAGGFSNSIVLARLKVATGGRFLWSRTVASTVVGQAFDTAVFLTVAFLGFLALDELVVVFVSNYVFKVAVEVLFTPITYGVVTLLKRAEREDHFDHATRLSPLPLGTD